MKNVFNPIAALFALLLLVAGCKKEDVDPCANITCLNGGTCANGSCNCPEQYTGSDCSQQKTPVRIKIQSVSVTQFPPTDNGAGWDLTSGPDIFVELESGGTTVFSTRSNFIQNANPASTHLFAPPSNSAFESPAATYILRLWDFDDDITTDDYMGGVQFTPYNSTNGFPETLFVGCPSCTVAFSVSVTYQF